MDETLNLTGLKCPLPALLTRKRLAAMAAGQILMVVTTDPLAAVDIPHMCAQEGHNVQSVTRQPGRDLFRICRG